MELGLIEGVKNEFRELFKGFSNFISYAFCIISLGDMRRGCRRYVKRIEGQNKMNYATIKPLDVANGTGIRVSLFVSGCRNHCRGCFNPETWNFEYGERFDEAAQKMVLDMLKPEYVSGLSLLGGDPLEPENEAALLPFVKKVRKMFPKKDIWMFTGYKYENVKQRPLVKLVDVLVDGPFILEQRNPKLAFRGSENQNIIYLKR